MWPSCQSKRSLSAAVSKEPQLKHANYPNHPKLRDQGFMDLGWGDSSFYGFSDSSGADPPRGTRPSGWWAQFITMEPTGMLPIRAHDRTLNQFKFSLFDFKFS